MELIPHCLKRRTVLSPRMAPRAMLLMSTRATTTFSQGMRSENEEIKANRDLLLKRLRKKSVVHSDKLFVLKNEVSVEELVDVLHLHREQSVETLKRAIESLKTLTLDKAVFEKITSLDVSLPLIQLLHSGPKEVQSEVSLFLYRLHSQSIKYQHLPRATFESTTDATAVDSSAVVATTQSKIASMEGGDSPDILTVDSVLAHGSILQASVPPLLRVLRTLFSSSARPFQKLDPTSSSGKSLDNQVYSEQEQEEALDALLRYTLKDTRLISTLISKDAFTTLVPLLFSGHERLVTKSLRLMALITHVESSPLTTQSSNQKKSLVHSLIFVLKTHHTDNDDSKIRTNTSAPTSARLQNSCLEILTRLVEGDTVAEEVVDERESMGSLVVNSGGLFVVLEIYDQNLAAAQQQGQHKHQKNHHKLDHSRPCQQKVVELLHALSETVVAVRWLFERERFDIVFGYLRSGDMSSRNVVIAEMYRVVCHLSVCDDDTVIESSSTQKHLAQRLAQKLLASADCFFLLLDTLVPTSATSPQEQQLQQAMCIICELLCYDDKFLAALFLNNDRHHALESLVAITGAAPPTAPTPLYCHPVNAVESDARLPEPPPYHSWNCQVTEATTEEKDACCPPSRLSALYTLYRMSAYARNDKKTVATFDLLWRADTAPALLQAFLNSDGRTCLRGRKYAALALAQLCEHPPTRNDLVRIQTESLGGINLLEMIEWFLQEEVYHR